MSVTVRSGGVVAAHIAPQVQRPPAMYSIGYCPNRSVRVSRMDTITEPARVPEVLGPRAGHHRAA